jgi:hypothetical protein
MNYFQSRPITVKPIFDLEIGGLRKFVLFEGAAPETGQQRNDETKPFLQVNCGVADRWRDARKGRSPDDIAPVRLSDCGHGYILVEFHNTAGHRIGKL